MSRVKSVDVLRGITITGMVLVNTPGTWSSVYKPLLHANWHGLTPTDLVFPFFLFIVGISISFAYDNKKAELITYSKIFIRSIKLFFLGIILNAFLPYLPFLVSIETIRIPGVLQRIALVFLISSILFLHFNWKVLLGISFTILISYYYLLGFVNLPDGSLPTFERSANNWANYIDSVVLKNHMWKKDYDPEGILSTLPSIATCLLGILIGNILKQKESFSFKLTYLFYCSIAFLGLGYFWSLWFPINKAIWSSSFVLVTAGWATLLLLLAYYFYDVVKIKKGVVFSYVGTNAIVIYFASSFISKTFYLVKVNEEQNIHSFLFETIFLSLISDNKFASFLYAISVVVFYLIVGYVLYKRKIFIKV